ncbi:MAG: hypothetical protein HY222_01520 [Thaumarchaeota archaeon]|nr:hypothetical protein [Nitrososphaerota archaeon]MBI3641053.1 hypothetical protein [Nitrososphaerota archaeon]
MPYKRPLGVTVRGLFYIIEGIIAIFCGVLLSTTAQYIETYLNRFSQRQEISMLLQILDGDLSRVLIIWLIVAGSAGIVIGIGVLKGKRWAWKITIIQTLLSIATGMIYFSYTNTANPISKLIGTALELIIGIVVIYYFFKPHVRAYFNRLPTQ